MSFDAPLFRTGEGLPPARPPSPPGVIPGGPERKPSAGSPDRRNLMVGLFVGTLGLGIPVVVMWLGR